MKTLLSRLNLVAFVILVSAFRWTSAAQPELVMLKELPQRGYASAPSLSFDGLTLYWQFTPSGEKQRWIWQAERKSADALFSNARKVMPGSDPAVTSDGLELIFLDGQQLYSSVRKTRQDDFGRPRRISELEGLGFLAAPCLSEDGLLLWTDHVQQGGKVEILRFRRASRDDAWQKPDVVKLPPIASNGRFIYASPKEGFGFCCVPELLKDKSANNIFYVDTADDGVTFSNPTPVELPGEVVRGKFPRHVAATRELFFSGDLEANGTAQLYAIRNFDPPAAKTSESSTLGGFAPSARAEVLFEPYRCRTAIEGIAFEGPPAKLAKTAPGVRFNVSRGPVGLAVDSTTGSPHWASPVQGRHVVRIRATSGSDSDEVEWILRVVQKEDADDLVIHSTKYLDFVLTKRQLEGDVFLQRKHYLDGIWECYYRLVGQEPLNDRQVFAWDPQISGALAGNPIRMGLGTGEAPRMGWTDSIWQRHGVEHELAHNFNVLIRTPGTWSSVKFAEGFGQPWLDQYLHHLCDNDIFILQQTVLKEPKFFGLNSGELASYRTFVANNVYYHRIGPDSAKKHLELIRSGKTMQEAAASSGNSTWQHLINTIIQRDGVEVLEGAFRAMRYDGLPAGIFNDATTPERKFSLLVSLLSASAKRDLRPFFADWGFVVEKDYYEKIHPRVTAGMRQLPPKDVWVNGWIKNPVNGRFCRVMRWKTDPVQAERTARQWGGRLIEAHSEKYLAWLARRFGHLGPIWLGLRDTSGKGDWGWNSGVDLDKGWWNTDEPKGAMGRYVVMGSEASPTFWSRQTADKEAVVIVERGGSDRENDLRISPTDNAKAKPTPRNHVVGTWDWGWGQPGTEPIMRTTITFNADGSVSQGKGKTGKWEQSGAAITIRWDNDTWVNLSLSDDQKRLEGKNNFNMPTRATRR